MIEWFKKEKKEHTESDSVDNEPAAKKVKYRYTIDDRSEQELLKILHENTVVNWWGGFDMDSYENLKSAQADAEYIDGIASTMQDGSRLTLIANRIRNVGETFRYVYITKEAVDETND